ncbi:MULTISPECIES: class I SAM-dependent methyltransferase [unclassified Paenibacillus]|uniref:class I SAM-dependent methyltransferase n=1 Tax=unclassified Paenibacillus TaxID=185978 RepID=UPI0036352553
MMNNEGLKDQQYSNSDKFNARIRLHAAFSTNPYPWPFWVMDQIEQAQPAKVLELGGGNGLLWMANASKIPSHWDITVSDYSEGMLNDARNNLSVLNNELKFEVMNAENINYPDHTFDIIIANHMLYHVDSREKALLEIRRVLKPSGIFYATTVGSNNMLEMKQLVKEFDPNSEYEQVLGAIEANFSLDNGKKQLLSFFADVSIVQYEDALLITESDALVDYVLSCNGLAGGKTVLDPLKAESFRAFINAKMDEHGGKLHITKESGMFVSRSL